MTAELVDPETGEVVQQMTADEARRATERIRLALDQVSTAWANLSERIAEAYERRADLALGYDSWQAYAETELKPPNGLAAEIRRELVARLSAEGMSTRAIAPAVGVTDRRVRKIVEQVGTEFPPAQQAAVENDPETVTKTSVTKVTGLDRKAYTKREPTKPRRRPITDAWRDLHYDLDKRLASLKNLTEDDRFDRSRAELADRNLARMKQTANTLAEVLAALEGNPPSGQSND